MLATNNAPPIEVIAADSGDRERRFLWAVHYIHAGAGIRVGCSARVGRLMHVNSAAAAVASVEK